MDIDDLIKHHSTESLKIRSCAPVVSCTMLNSDHTHMEGLKGMKINEFQLWKSPDFSHENPRISVMKINLFQSLSTWSRPGMPWQCKSALVQQWNFSRDLNHQMPLISIPFIQVWTCSGSAGRDLLTNQCFNNFNHEKPRISLHEFQAWKSVIFFKRDHHEISLISLLFLDQFYAWYSRGTFELLHVLAWQTITFQLTHENKSCLACLQDQHKNLTHDTWHMACDSMRNSNFCVHIKTKVV